MFIFAGFWSVSAAEGKTQKFHSQRTANFRNLQNFAGYTDTVFFVLFSCLVKFAAALFHFLVFSNFLSFMIYIYIYIILVSKKIFVFEIFKKLSNNNNNFRTVAKFHNLHIFATSNFAA